MSRPAEEPRVSFTVRLPRSLAERLDAIAERDLRSRNGVVEVIIRGALERGELDLARVVGGAR